MPQNTEVLVRKTRLGAEAQAGTKPRCWLCETQSDVIYRKVYLRSEDNWLCSGNMLLCTRSWIKRHRDMVATGTELPEGYNYAGTK